MVAESFELIKTDPVRARSQRVPVRKIQDLVFYCFPFHS